MNTAKLKEVRDYILSNPEKLDCLNKTPRQIELEAAFELVKPKTHWKDEIDSYCTSDEIRMVGDAIRHFTATEAMFDAIGCSDKDHGRFKQGDYIFKVQADGYRKGPAGDH